MDIKKASYSMWDLFNIKKEIQEAWESSFDEETGEIIAPDFENKVRKLEMDKEVVFADLGRFVQAMKNYSEMVSTQIKDLQAKKKQYNDQMESIKSFIRFELPEDQKIQFPDITIGWRKSEAVEVDEEQVDHSQLDHIGALDFTPKIKKTEIKKYLKENPDFKLKGIELIKKKNITIK